jgi:hypothetical protein
MYNFSVVFYCLMFVNKFQLNIQNCCNCRYPPYFVYLHHNKTSHFTVPQLQSLASERMFDFEMIHSPLYLNKEICSRGKNSPYIFRILWQPDMLLMFENHFNIIFPSTIAGFKFFDYHLCFILKFCKQFLFLHTTRPTKFIFLYLMRLRICIKTEYKNIADAN